MAKKRDNRELGRAELAKIWQKKFGLRSAFAAALHVGSGSRVRKWEADRCGLWHLTTTPLAAVSRAEDEALAVLHQAITEGRMGPNFVSPRDYRLFGSPAGFQPLQPG